MKIKYLAFSLVLVFALLAVSSCEALGIPTPSFDNNPTVSPTPTVVETPSPINPSFIPQSTSESKTPPTLPDFVSVIAGVRPSVVAINTKVPALNIFGSSFVQEGAGSGWIIDASGLIVTNNHVVEGANSVTVTLEDGRNFPADMVRTDPVSDLAVVKINGQNLKAARVGDSAKLRVGDWVVAIGNSLGQGIGATKGIVSALGVSVSAGSGETLYDLIQTDAAINPGNSGGPLVNLLGEVVGINSIKVAQVGVEGMGYAISSKVSIPIIDSLVKVGYVTRPWLGVSLYTVDQIVVQRYRLPVNKGVLVTQVSPGSPAESAGLKAGDVVISIDGKDIASVDDLTQIIRGHQIGQKIEITYYRGSNKNTATAILSQSPIPGKS